MASRNLDKKLFQPRPLTQYGSRTHLCVFPPTVNAPHPGKRTLTSHRWSLFYTTCHRQTNTYWPSGLFFWLLLAPRKFSCFEVVDYMSCPSWSLRLGSKDKWHLFVRASAYLDRKNLQFDGRVPLTKQSRVIPCSFSTGASRSPSGKFLPESNFLLFLAIVVGDTEGCVRWRKNPLVPQEAHVQHT